jgi:hypothetical protein
MHAAGARNAAGGAGGGSAGEIANGGAGSGGGPSSAGNGGNAGNTAGGGGRTAGSGGKSASGNGAGGAAGTGGNAAGASGAAGSATGASGCGARDYILCEDFEGTAVGSTPRGWTRHGDRAAVADDAAKGGARSLKLRPVAAEERRIYHDAAALGSAHWGRIYYKVEQPVPDAFVHSTLVSFPGDAPSRGRSEFRVIDTVKQAVDTKDVGSMHQYLYNVQVIGESEFSREGPYDQKFEDRWHCVEYHIDGAKQAYALYVDGKEEIAFEDGPEKYARSDIPMTFEELRVGWVNYQQAAPGFTAWIDEIAFDEPRVGCE